MIATIPDGLDANDLLSYYYLHPAPRLLPTILAPLIVANPPETGEYGSLVVWLAAVVRARGALQDELVARLRETGDAALERLLDDALAQRDPRSGAVDRLWATYFATGALEPLAQIVTQLDDDGPGIVAWSIRANAYQHARVRRFCEDTAARLPSSPRRRVLVEIIAAVDARIARDGPCQTELRARALLDNYADDPPLDESDAEQVREAVARLRADADSLPDAEFVRANALRDRAIALLERLREIDPLAGTTLANVIVDRAYSLQASDPAGAAEGFERARAVYERVGTAVARRNAIEVGLYLAIALREAADPRAEAFATAALAAADEASLLPGNEALVEAVAWARQKLS